MLILSIKSCLKFRTRSDLRNHPVQTVGFNNGDTKVQKDQLSFFKVKRAVFSIFRKKNFQSAEFCTASCAC